MHGPGWIQDFGHGGGGGGAGLTTKKGCICVRACDEPFLPSLCESRGGGAPQTFFLFYSVHCASE